MTIRYLDDVAALGIVGFGTTKHAEVFTLIRSLVAAGKSIPCKTVCLARFVLSDAGWSLMK